MAINPQKLLPPSKGITSTLANFSGVSSNLLIRKKTSDVNRISQLSAKYNEQNVDIVRRSLIDVDALLKSVLTEDKNITESKRRRKEREEFEERESNLEVPNEQKKFRLPQVSLPGMSFLDRVKRFLLFTGIGWLFTNFQDQLPKLVGIVKIITPLYGVVENVFKFILSSVVNFIERGYETYDKIRALVKSVGGEGAQQSFDALSSKLNEYINYILIGGMALTGAISAFATNVSKFKPQAPRPVAAAGRPKVTTGVGGTSIRTGAARITTSGGKLVERNIAKNIFKRVVKPVLSKLPIVGALIEFGLSWALGDPVGKAAFRGIGSLLVGAVGTAIGGPIGAAIGGILGGEIGGKLYDTFFGSKKPTAYRNGGRVIKAYAKGGGVLGDYGLGRTLEVERSKKPSPPPQPTQPGRDVGGSNEIKKLFPNPNENILTYGKPNPFYALENTASDLKNAPYGLGSLMGGAIDVALGQKLSTNAILNASIGLENMFYDNYDRDKNYIDVRSIIFGVIKSAADSALNNIQNELSKGKKKEKEKEKPIEEPDAYIQPGTYNGVPSGAGSAALLAKTASEMKGFSSAGGPGGGREACVWAVNQVYKRAGLTPPWGSSEYVPTAEQMMIKKGYTLVSENQRQAGDIYIAYDRESPPQIHIGIVLANGNILSNSSSGAKFSWEDTPDGYARQYGARGKFYRMPGGDVQFSPNANQTIASTGKVVSADSGLRRGGLSPIQKQALDIISGPESGGDYNAMNRGGAGDSPGGAKKWLGKNLTDMSIGEVLSLQKQGKVYATGRYQFVPNTLPGVMRSAGLSSNDRYSEANQDLMAASLIRERGAQPWTVGGSKYSAEQLKIIEQARKVEKGGDVSRISSSNNYIPKQPSKYNTKSIETYPDYAEGRTKPIVLYQRIVVEKKVPVPMGGKSRTDFMIAGGGSVNNNMSSHRG